jgi:flavorubredoxin
MHTPTMLAASRVAPDTTSLSAYFPLPGLGILPVNAFVIHAVQPMLVDTGLLALREPFLQALERSIDPATIRWIWLSHMDADHLGNLEAILALAHNAKLVTNFLGMGKLILRNLDVSRVHLLAPAAAIDAGDRSIVPLKPPYYDAPETVGFFDTRTRVLFCSDAFGTLLQQPEEEAAAIRPDAFFDGMAAWTAIDAPWLGMIDRAAFGRILAGIERLDPTAIISSHLPVARGITGELLGHLNRAIASDKMATTDHDAVEQLMAAA